jgi:superfamily II DNA or RNA helicase
VSFLDWWGSNLQYHIEIRETDKLGSFLSRPSRGFKKQMAEPFHSLMFDDEWEELELWDHQIQAVRLLRDYLRTAPEGAALIRMPTGTGKTGIMAVISQFSIGGSILIVVPWAHLKTQIRAELQGGFWRKLGISSFNPRPVILFTPTNFPELSQASPSVIVCTYQTLQVIQQTNPTAYHSLRKHIDLVLADEGHREPAPSWSLAVRGLAKPSVLFTATPYRNDFYAFKIAEGFVFRLPHRVAETERYIRSVTVHERNVTGDASQFVDELISFYEGPFQSLKPSTVTLPRVIVRCENDSEIQEIAALLRERSHSAIEIHDTFTDSEEEGRYHAVPQPSNKDATFWVHQNKLIEGLAGPNRI